MSAHKVQGLALTLAFLLLGMTQAATSQTVATFKVATFNVTGGYAQWSERLPVAVATMLRAKASIYLIQEAHEGEGEHRQVLREFHRQSHDRWRLIAGRGGNHFIIDSGKYTVLRDPTNVRLPHGRWYSELNLKHRQTGVRFWVWNTHLTSTMLPERPSDVADQMREDQARVIVEYVKRLHRSVGGGDTNNGVAGLRVNLAAVGHDEVRTRTSNVTNGEWDSHDRYQPNQMRGRWMDLLAVGSRTTVNACGLVDSGDSTDHNLIWASVSIPR